MKTCLQIILVKKKITLVNRVEKNQIKFIRKRDKRSGTVKTIFIYEPPCSTHSKSCNNEGRNIEVDVVAGVRIVKKNQEMDAHSLRLVLGNCFLGK